MKDSIENVQSVLESFHWKLANSGQSLWVFFFLLIKTGISHSKLLKLIEITINKCTVKRVSTKTVQHRTKLKKKKRKKKNHRGAFASGAASPGSPCRRTAASEREEKRKTATENGGEEREDRRTRTHWSREVSDVVCGAFLLECGGLGPSVYRCSEPSLALNRVGTWVTFHILLGVALLWHPRAPLCCKQVGKVGESRLGGCSGGRWGHLKDPAWALLTWLKSKVLFFLSGPFSNSCCGVSGWETDDTTQFMDRARELPVVEHRS